MIVITYLKANQISVHMTFIQKKDASMKNIMEYPKKTFLLIYKYFKFEFYIIVYCNFGLQEKRNTSNINLKIQHV